MAKAKQHINKPLPAWQGSIEDLQAICSALPAVTEDIKWENHLCFCIGGKMFLMIGLDEVPVTASLKVDEDAFVQLQERRGFKPAPYLARYKWIWMDDITRLSQKEWLQLIENAYNLVAARLPLKVKTQLGIAL